MITFVSLFLGLVSGTQPVELAVSGPVSAVVLELDGQTVAKLEAPPWHYSVDLGSELRPHRLRAVALDAAGNPIDHAEQLLNWPREEVEAKVVLDDWHDGLPRKGRLLWETTLESGPTALRLTLDGQPLEVGMSATFELPTIDPAIPHFLHAEIDFSDTLSTTAEASFGGTYGSSVATELSPIPVFGGRKPLSVDLLEGTMSSAGQTLRVAAIDDGPAEVVVVRDDRSRPSLTRLAQLLQRTTTSLGLDPGDDLRIMANRARSSHRGERSYKLYPVSPPLSKWQQPVVSVQAVLDFDSDTVSGKQSLGEAVAVAGLHAAASRRRRAVVLITSGQQRTYGRWRPEEVREFLTSLGVPLRVWNTHPGQSADDGWGGDRQVKTREDALRAFIELRRLLTRQRIVWVEGRRLPYEVEFSRGARRLIKPLR